MGTGLHVFVKQILEPLAGIKSLFFCLLHSRESCVIVEVFFVCFVCFAKVCVVSRIIKNHYT